MSLQDVALCIGVIEWFVNKAYSMKNNWADAAALMERCALCKPLLDQIMESKHDQRYVSEKLNLHMETAAAEPCVVVLLALFEEIKKKMDQFTQRTWTAGFTRFAFTKTYAGEIAAFEARRSAVFTILVGADAQVNERRRQIDHEEFVGAFHQRMEEMCVEIGDAREENKDILARISLAIEGGQGISVDAQSAITTRLEELRNNIQQVLEAQQSDKELFITKMGEQSSEMTRVLQHIVEQGKIDLLAKFAEANKSSDELLLNMQQHTSHELQAISSALQTSVSSAAGTIHALVEEKFQVISSSLGHIEEGVAAVSGKVDNVLAQLTECTNELKTQIAAANEANKKDIVALGEALRAQQAQEGEVIRSALVGRVSEMNSKLEVLGASQQKCKAEVLASMVQNSEREREYVTKVLLNAVDASKSALLSRFETADGEMRAKLQEIKRELSSELQDVLSSIETSMSEHMERLRQGFYAKFAEFASSLGRIEQSLEKLTAIATGGQVEILTALGKLEAAVTQIQPSSPLPEVNPLNRQKSLEVLAKKNARAMPIGERLPTPNKDVQAPVEMAKQIFDAASADNVQLLTLLCREWSGNSPVIDGYLGQVRKRHHTRSTAPLFKKHKKLNNVKKFIVIIIIILTHLSCILHNREMRRLF